MSVYYLCPDSDNPTGGIKVIYRHVDLLNAQGIPAYVLHRQRGFRCTWFDNNTQVAYASFPSKSLLARARDKFKSHWNLRGTRTIPVAGGTSSEIGPTDLLVVPERDWPLWSELVRDIPKVILNQSGFLSFKKYSFAQTALQHRYDDPTVRGVLVNSQYCEEYVRYAFPQANIQRFCLSIDPSLFRFEAHKRKRICFSRIKNASDALQVVNMLKFRDALRDFEIAPFINLSQIQVAERMRESLIFLNFGNREGFGLPAAEAMACGCITIGYHGWGGKEFFRDEFSFPIEDGDILGYARQVETVIRACDADPGYFAKEREAAAVFVADNYSAETEERTLIRAWKQILG